MAKEKNYSLLKKFCLGLGIDLFGVAETSQIKNEFAFPERVLARFDKAIALGVALSQGVLEEIQDHPTKLYFHHYRTLNTFLDQAALRLAHFIQAKGSTALAVPASQIIDWEKQSAHLSHKKIGFLAGLGWIGRNNLLVHKKFGSQFRLVTVLTDLPLKTDKPSKGSCGSCRLCIAACPAGAIKDGPASFDHRRCFEKLKEFQRLRLTDQYICGVCLKACGGATKQSQRLAGIDGF